MNRLHCCRTCVASRVAGRASGPCASRSADRRWNARLCAVRKTEAAAEKAKKRYPAGRSKKGKQLEPETRSSSPSTSSCSRRSTAISLARAETLDLYRARWQIELCFKRLKSLLRLGHLPKRSDESARAWIEGKLLTVLLVERLIEEARFFSPWGFDLRRAAVEHGVNTSRPAMWFRRHQPPAPTRRNSCAWPTLGSLLLRIRTARASRWPRVPGWRL